MLTIYIDKFEDVKNLKIDNKLLNHFNDEEQKSIIKKVYSKKDYLNHDLTHSLNNFTDDLIIFAISINKNLYEHLDKSNKDIYRDTAIKLKCDFSYFDYIYLNEVVELTNDFTNENIVLLFDLLDILNKNSKDKMKEIEKKYKVTFTEKYIKTESRIESPDRRHRYIWSKSNNNVNIIYDNIDDIFNLISDNFNKIINKLIIDYSDVTFSIFLQFNEDIQEEVVNILFNDDHYINNINKRIFINFDEKYSMQFILRDPSLIKRVDELKYEHIRCILLNNFNNILHLKPSRQISSYSSYGNQIIDSSKNKQTQENINDVIRQVIEGIYSRF